MDEINFSKFKAILIIAVIGVTLLIGIIFIAVTFKKSIESNVNKMTVDVTGDTSQFGGTKTKTKTKTETPNDDEVSTKVKTKTKTKNDEK